MKRSILLGLSVVAATLWVVSLLLPALSFRFDGERDQVLTGYEVLLSGYMHLVALEFSWLANLGFWLAFWFFWRTSYRYALRIVGIALFLLTLQSIEIFLLDDFFQHPRAFPGYYVWMASNLLMAALAVHRPSEIASSGGPVRAVQ